MNVDVNTFRESASLVDNLPQHVLCVGIDASGKSTLLDGLSSSFGYDIVEPTSSPEARGFKSRTIDTAVDASIIDEREQIYLRLNDLFAVSIEACMEEDARIASTGSHLVTRLSHMVMKRTIGENVSRHGEKEVLLDWVDSSRVQPEAITLTHAPFEVIRGRILSRQAEGDVLERFWGFNSMLFLENYQDAWHVVLDEISQETDIDSFSFDTSEDTPTQMLSRFADGYRNV